MKAELTRLVNGLVVGSGGKKKKEMKEITGKSYGIYPKLPTASRDIWISIALRA